MTLKSSFPTQARGLDDALRAKRRLSALSVDDPSLFWSLAFHCASRHLPLPLSSSLVDVVVAGPTRAAAYDAAVDVRDALLRQRARARVADQLEPDEVEFSLGTSKPPKDQGHHDDLFDLADFANTGFGW